MSIRSFVLRAFLPVALAMPLAMVPTTNAGAADQVTLRISEATFTGIAYIERARPGRPATLHGSSRTCNVAGVKASSPFLVTCHVEFDSGPAPVSSNCTATWIHQATLSFIEPISGESVVILYDPVTTTIAEGDGAGNGASPLHLGSIHYAIESLCVASEDQAEGNLVGYASAL